MYFPDLQEYGYAGSRFSDVRMVGWLERGHRFDRGETTLQQREHLAKLALTSVARRMRGLHQCDLCPLWRRLFQRGRATLVRTSSGDAWLGAAEIWVPRSKGGYWASPDLIVHYVEFHRYRPPAEFLDDMLDHDPPVGWIPPKLRELGFTS